LFQIINWQIRRAGIARVKGFKLNACSVCRSSLRLRIQIEIGVFEPSQKDSENTLLVLSAKVMQIQAGAIGIHSLHEYASADFRKVNLKILMN
jgi:hypothetical protein